MDFIRKISIKKAFPAILITVLSIVAISAQHGHVDKQAGVSAKGTNAGGARTGILLLAHGGKETWNNEVKRIAAAVDRTMPVEVAFGMASKRSMQEAIERLNARGVAEIVAVPLFVSSHSSVITSTEYLLGLRREAPTAVAIFAKMDHGHGTAGSPNLVEGSFDPTTPIKSPVPVRMVSALNQHPLVAEILSSRASILSRHAEKEVVVVVAHGPVSDEDNNRWLADMGALVKRMRVRGNFKRIEYMTVRDDAPEAIRAQATADLRQLVERAAGDGDRVLIVPLLLSYGGIEAGIKKRLEGLRYTMSDQALLPDERLTQWVLQSVKENSTGKR